MQGGGSAAQAALERAEEALRSLRICVNPSLAAANYVFLPTAAAPPPAAAEPRGTAGAASHGARRVGANAGEGDATPASMNRSRDMAATHAPRGGNSTGGGAAHGQGRRRSRQQQGRGAADAPPRLQHDGGLPFASTPLVTAVLPVLSGFMVMYTPRFGLGVVSKAFVFVGEPCGRLSPLLFLAGRASTASPCLHDPGYVKPRTSPFRD